MYTRKESDVVNMVCKKKLCPSLAGEKQEVSMMITETNLLVTDSSFEKDNNKYKASDVTKSNDIIKQQQHINKTLHDTSNNNLPSMTSTISANGINNEISSPSSSHSNQDNDKSNTKTTQPIISPNITSLNELIICRRLGKGQFGRVNLVHHPQTNTYYAMKEISKLQLTNKKQEHLINRETAIMTLVRHHPFIIKLLSTFDDEKNIYMVQDFHVGGELYGVIHNKNKNNNNSMSNGGVSNKDAKFYTACVHQALLHIHSHQIAHRDLKPENILIDEKGYCILIDFGNAKQLSNADDSSSSSRTYTICGTPEYAAPEVILSRGHDHSVDNWALGILLFELLTQRTPFYNANDVSERKMFRRILAKRFEFPSSSSSLNNDEDNNKNKNNFCGSSKDLVDKLLMTSPTMRLRGGDVTKHEFFEGVEWERILERGVAAPWCPEPLDPNDAMLETTTNSNDWCIGGSSNCHTTTRCDTAAVGTSTEEVPKQRITAESLLSEINEHYIPRAQLNKNNGLSSPTTTTTTTTAAAAATPKQQPMEFSLSYESLYQKPPPTKEMSSSSPTTLTKNNHKSSNDLTAATTRTNESTLDRTSTTSLTRSKGSYSKLVKRPLGFIGKRLRGCMCVV